MSFKTYFREVSLPGFFRRTCRNCFQKFCLCPQNVQDSWLLHITKCHSAKCMVWKPKKLHSWTQDDKILEKRRPNCYCCVPQWWHLQSFLLATQSRRTWKLRGSELCSVLRFQTSRLALLPVNVHQFSCVFQTSHAGFGHVPRSKMRCDPISLMHHDDQHRKNKFHHPCISHVTYARWSCTYICRTYEKLKRITITTAVVWCKVTVHAQYWNGNPPREREETFQGWKHKLNAWKHNEGDRLKMPCCWKSGKHRFDLGDSKTEKCFFPSHVLCERKSANVPNTTDKNLNNWEN